MGHPEGSIQSGRMLKVEDRQLKAVPQHAVDVTLVFHHSQPKHPMGSTIILPSLKCISVFCVKWLQIGRAHV